MKELLPPASLDLGAQRMDVLRSSFSLPLQLTLFVCWSDLSLLSIMLSHCSRWRLSMEGQLAGAAPQVSILNDQHPEEKEALF